jgi:uncharacterized membrane protein YdjX (TVP38/TMEM64 family)
MPRLPRADRRWWTVAVGFIVFGGVGLALVVGAPALGLKGVGDVQRLFAAAQGPWALPVAVAAFAALAFIGVPQIVLIAAATVVLGPVRGALYSWVGTMISALIGFGIGRAFGMKALAGLQWPGLERFMGAVGRNGFFASLVVRLAPFAPFVLINMAAGVTPMGLLDFAAGTAVGIIPKIALTAFAGDSALRAVRGGGAGAAALAALAVLALVLAGWAARRWIRSRR